jgi:serine/threonine protein kinase
MQYLEGETLEARLRKSALPIDQALPLGIQIADALDKAHRTGIVHRDLKPGKVMLTKAGAKLLDFADGPPRPFGFWLGWMAATGVLIALGVAATVRFGPSVPEPRGVTFVDPSSGEHELHRRICCAAPGAVAGRKPPGVRSHADGWP